MIKIQIKHKTFITKGICLLFMLLFVYAAVGKLVDFQTFRVQLGQSPILTSIAGLVAYGIPTIEIILAIALSFNKLRTIALYVSLGLMAAFTMYIIAILNFSDYIPCSCGGILENMGWIAHLIFNLVFVFLAAIAILLESHTTINQEKDIQQYIKT